MSKATCKECTSPLSRQEGRESKVDDIKARDWSLTFFSLVCLHPWLSHGSLRSHVNILITHYLCHWS